MKEFVYEGDENYIFVSYCHQDKDRVLPVIKRLSENGARIWYDRGIHPGSVREKENRFLQSRILHIS